jgi:hypothetical protein
LTAHEIKGKERSTKEDEMKLIRRVDGRECERSGEKEAKSINLQNISRSLTHNLHSYELMCKKLYLKVSLKLLSSLLLLKFYFSFAAFANTTTTT